MCWLGWMDSGLSPSIREPPKLAHSLRGTPTAAWYNIPTDITIKQHKRDTARVSLLCWLGWMDSGLSPSLWLGMIFRLTPNTSKTKEIPRGYLFCFGWAGWIRTIENARVKVWCLTAWLQPNNLYPYIITHMCFNCQVFFGVF